MKIVIVHQNFSTSLPGALFRTGCIKTAEVVHQKTILYPPNGLIISSGSRQTQAQVEALFCALQHDNYEVWPELNPYSRPFYPERRFSLDIIVEKIIFEARNRQIDYLVVVLDQNREDLAQLFFNVVSPDSSHLGFPEFFTNQVIELDTENEGVTIVSVDKATIQK